MNRFSLETQIFMQETHSFSCRFVWSGSIKYVHQQCLMEWLKHKNQSFCELCKHPFQFKPVYKDGAPSTLPVSTMMGWVFADFLQYLPFLARSVLVSHLAVQHMLLFPLHLTPLFSDASSTKCPFVVRATLIAFSLMFVSLFLSLTQVLCVWLVLLPLLTCYLFRAYMSRLGAEIKPALLSELTLYGRLL